MKERLLEFIGYKGMPVSQFEKLCGMSNAYIKNMSKGIGVEKLECILNKFPELNKQWLLYGEGEMLISDKSTDVNIDNSTNIGHHNNMGHHNSIGCTTQAISPNEYADLQAQNADLQAQIDALHSLVTSLREQIDDLRKDKENLYQLLFKK